MARGSRNSNLLGLPLCAPGQRDNTRVTIHNLEVIEVGANQKLLFVRSMVPGHNDGVVRTRRAAARK